MKIKETVPRYITYSDHLGVTRRIYCCSLRAREQFSEVYTAFWKHIRGLAESEDTAMLTFSELYLQDELIQDFIEELLYLANVDPNSINFEQLITLLLPYEEPAEIDGDKRVYRGMLVDLNFPTTDVANQTSMKPMSYTDIVALISKLTDDFQQAYDAVMNLPGDELLAIIEARNTLEESIDPESTKKAQQNAALNDIKQNGIDFDNIREANNATQIAMDIAAK